MKRKIIALFLSTALSLSMLTACSDEKEKKVAESGTTVDVEDLVADSDSELPITNSDSDAEVHAHSYTESVTVAPTCTEAGEKTFSCDCGDTYTEAIEATGHNYEVMADSAVNATCEADGKEADAKCSACSDVVSGAVIPATGHSYEAVADSSAEPSCTKDGKEEDMMCSSCKDVVEGNPIPATGHDYGEYVYNNDATTEADGTETATCQSCGKEKTRTAKGTIRNEECVIPNEDGNTDAPSTNYESPITNSGTESSGAGSSITNSESGITNSQGAACQHPVTTDVFVANYSVSINPADPECGCGYNTSSYDVTCTSCGAVLSHYERVLHETHDTVVISEGIVPTCTTDGKNDVFSCSCGKTEPHGGEVVKAWGHDYHTNYTGEISDDGMKARIITQCIICGDIIMDIWE